MGFHAFVRTIINQPLCQKFSARSVKNCMTSMQLCRDHPGRLPACLLVRFAKILKDPYFCLVCLSVCLSVCLWTALLPVSIGQF